MQTHHFLRLLGAELAGCDEDLRDFGDLLGARLKTMEITNYVYRENDALLKLELVGVKEIRRRVEALDPNAFASLDQAVTEVRTLVHNTIVEHQLPEAIIPLIERRIQNARRYILSDLGEPTAVN